MRFYGHGDLVNRTPASSREKRLWASIIAVISNVVLPIVAKMRGELILGDGDNASNNRIGRSKK
jgi:hypothetical protein